MDDVADQGQLSTQPAPLVDVQVAEDPSLTLLASSGFSARAQELGQRLAAARRFFRAVFQVDLTELRALVLDEAGWRVHCPFPDYGMPFHQPPVTVYAAAVDNDLWRAAVPDLTTLPSPVADRLAEIYGGPDGYHGGRFFDLLVVHELAHLFAHRARLRFPRRWLLELFCNLALHSYVERQEPGQLAPLTVLPEVVAAVPVELLAHHTLRDWEELFERVGPMAFAWYQCRLHRAAATIYQADGPRAVTAMWEFFADGAARPAVVPDADLPALLTRLSPTVAAVVTSWPGEH